LLMELVDLRLRQDFGHGHASAAGKWVSAS
jgi:hypothetical protein